jgi:thymidylate kinase
VTASDRRRQHRRARSLAGLGYLVVCDRFPLEQVTLMDGSRTRWVPSEGLSPLARRLVEAEQRCYAGISDPDLLLILRVDPDTAVARKQGVDPADFVRPRSAEVFAADWTPRGRRTRCWRRHGLRSGPTCEHRRLPPFAT